MERRLIFECEHCGCMEYSDIEGWGDDEYGNFTDYWCEECGQLSRMYEEE